MSDLKTQLQHDMRQAMKSKRSAELSTLRQILAAIQRHEIDQQTAINDQEILQLLNKMVKQRREAMQQFQQAGRHDLWQKEQDELTLIEHYLPQPFSEEELKQLIDTAFQHTQAKEPRDMGLVMGYLKPKLAGRANLTEVSQMVKQQLSE